MDPNVGHLNGILARVGGNLNKNFQKSQMPGGLPGGGGILKLRFDRYISGERAENAIFQNDQSHKNREVERGRSVELVSSTPCPPI